MKKQILIFALINVLFLVYGFNLKQRNPEELFLSDQSLKELSLYESYFGKDDLTFVTGLDTNSEKEIENSVLEKNGEYISLSPIVAGSGILRLPDLDDEAKFNYFKTIQQNIPSLKLAGMDFTNAHLAGMSLKIQQILFPCIFAIMFTLLWIIFRNITIPLYLFLSSFLGVSIGLATTQYFYSYSTILTSLTPLVSFILTLASQLHVVFGIHVFKTKKEFLKHKMAPILIMMITTIIGFFSLIYSDLNSIRQFGLTATLTLTLTWGLNLLILKNIDLEFHIPKLTFLKKLSPPSYRPFYGYLIPILLFILGGVSLKTMPTLVEAILFFPQTHEVRIGHEEIQKKLGGTPQVDLVLTRIDQKNLEFEDYKIINQYENDLQRVLKDYQLLTSNRLIQNANFLYTQVNQIPEEKNAYFALKGRTPSLLQSSLVADQAYKISILSKALSQREREELLESLRNSFINLPKNYAIKFSGLNTLLLDSQVELVNTLLTSLMGSFALIALLFAFFSRNLKEIFHFSLISLSSIFGGLFLMKLCGFSLNVASIMTLSISIGLVDDSTIHLLYAQKHNETQEQIQNSCIVPMVLSHFVLFISFMLLGFEPFVVIREFALGLVAMLAMGLMLDLFVLPMITNKKAH
jgi:predicted RND superfamily exporter protein